MQSNDISFSKAVDALRASRKVETEEAARKWLISALMLGEIVAHAESWWVWDSENSFDKPSLSGDDHCIPLDFWQSSHAVNFAPNGTTYPSGHWGNWKIGRFHSSVVLTGSAAARRSTSFYHLANLGVQPVQIEWAAIGCTVSLTCLNHLIEIGGPNNVSRRAKRLTEIRLPSINENVEIEDNIGMAHSVTINELIARSFVLLLSDKNVEQVAADPSTFLHIFRGVNDDHFIDIDGLPYFSELTTTIAHEARKILSDKASSAPN